MPADNPFVYGEIVPADAFVGRDNELRRLAGDLANGQKVFLISPRRYGKSSLVRQTFHALARQKITTLEFTVSSFSSYVAFLEGYARALVSLQTRAVQTRGWIRDLFSTAKPEVRPDSGGAGGMTLAFPAVRTPRDAARLAEEVFALPARLADGLGRRLVIALDEFQAIGSFNGGSVEQALRAAVQQQRHVGYVFAGSEPTLMEQMIGPKRPFYKAGPVMRLQKIPAATREQALDARERLDRRRATPVDIDVLPDDPLHVRPHERGEGRDVDLSGSGAHAEVLEVRLRVPVGKPGHGTSSGVRPRRR